MKNNKINPLLNHIAIIKSPQDIQILSKLNINTPQALFFGPGLSSSKIEKITKRLKFLKKVKSNNEYGLPEGLRTHAHYLTILKRLHQSRSVVYKSEFFAGYSQFNPQMWLTVSKRLEEITLIVEERCLSSLEKLMKFFLIMGYLHIKRFRIINQKMHSGSNRHLENFFSQKFPSSLESITISYYGRTVDTNGLENTLSHLTQLRELTLEMESKLAGVLLNSVRNFSGLRKLDLTIPDSSILGDLDLLLEGLKQSQKLRIMNLCFITKWIPIQTKFLAALKDCPIEEFKFEIFLDNQDTIDSLATFLAGSHGFKSLELKIMNHFLSTAAKTLIPVIKKTLAQSTQLETFSLRTNSLDVSEISRELLPVLLNKPATLKKQEIDVNGTYEPSVEEFIELLKFLETLQKIEIFKVPQLYIPNDSMFLRMTNIVCNWKELRTLWFGSLQAIKSSNLFIELVEKILSKRGVEKFECLFTIKFTEFIASNKAFNKINLKNVKRKNPCLEHYPYNFPIYTAEEEEVNTGNSQNLFQIKNRKGI